MRGFIILYLESQDVGLIYMRWTHVVRQLRFGLWHRANILFRRPGLVNSWVQLVASIRLKAALNKWLGHVGVGGIYSNLKYCITKPVCQPESIHLCGFSSERLWHTCTDTHTCTGTNTHTQSHTWGELWAFSNTCVHRGVSEVRRTLLRIIKHRTEVRRRGRGGQKRRRRKDRGIKH